MKPRLCELAHAARGSQDEVSQTLMGSLKLGNVWVFIQLIFGPQLWVSRNLVFSIVGQSRGKHLMAVAE